MTTRVINGVVYEFDPKTPPEVIDRFVAKKSAEGQPAAAPVAAPQTRQAAQGPRPEAALPGYAGQALHQPRLAHQHVAHIYHQAAAAAHQPQVAHVHVRSQLGLPPVGRGLSLLAAGRPEPAGSAGAGHIELSPEERLVAGGLSETRVV